MPVWSPNESCRCEHFGRICVTQAEFYVLRRGTRTIFGAGSLLSQRVFESLYFTGVIAVLWFEIQSLL